MNKTTSRRDFLTKAAVTAALTAPTVPQALASLPASSAPAFEIMRSPDQILGRFGTKEVLSLKRQGSVWTCRGINLSVEPVREAGGTELRVRLDCTEQGITSLHLRWQGRMPETVQSIGDHWERSYGDLEWRGTVPNRIMPWYFLTRAENRVAGYGVKTQPSAFCFWLRDSDGVSLVIDLKNGGSTADLRGRTLEVCSIVEHHGLPGEPVHAVARTFCAQMCSTPRLPKGAIYGANDWNYAYGKNTAEGILRQADLIAELAPSKAVRPYIVIDDGWQDTSRFPDMAALAAQIAKRNLRPGMWVRPLQASSTALKHLLLPAERFGKRPAEAAPAFDPTIPEALVAIERSLKFPIEHGYEFVKHDFSTYELFGRWGFQMNDEITASGWNFADRTKTNAEIIADFYRVVRRAVGEQTVVLGCNTVGHLAAGIFESQRIGDDTSGRDWERTRRYGINTLAHRISQHKTFFHADPDCVAITPEIGWRETSQWMDVVARTGTSLFLSPAPAAITPEIKSAMRDAMALVVQSPGGFPTNPASGTTPEEWTFASSTNSHRRYSWTEHYDVSLSTTV